MSKQSMALLSQREIDTLIHFLNGEKWKIGVDNEVLNQESVDRLIALIRSTNGRRGADGLRMLMERSEELKQFYAARDDSYEDAAVYGMVVRTADSGQVELYAQNKNSGKEVPLYPEHLHDFSLQEGGSGWGICLMPRIFYQVADRMGLEYTTELEEQVKKQFAKVMYGDENIELPDLYL